jgi:cell division protease FtsH
MKKNRFRFLWYLIGFAVFFFLAAWILSENSQQTVSYSEVVGYFHNIGSEDENAVSVTEMTLTSSNELTLKLSNGTTVSTTLQNLSIFYEDCWDYLYDDAGNLLIDKIDLPEPVSYPAWISALPWIIILIAFIALWIYVIRQAGAGGSGTSRVNGFGKSRAKMTLAGEKNKIRFSDVAGADEEKQELEEIVEFLKDPAKFTKLGAKIPHGVLLVGPPGTGKTLLAKAVAGEAGVPFYSISGSDFVEMYVGVGASRVRDLFDNARKNPASIIFIDEIDAVGRHRGAGLGGGHDEREQTLNQLLVEMDGFAGSEGIIVMAATNRPDILDPALLRPGRFDRQVTVNYPDVRGREEILKVHSKGKPFEESVDLSVIARGTTGFTGADLANLLNEAALLAARRGKALIGMNDIEDAKMKILLGTQKKSMKLKEEDKYETAIHEAGHAVLFHLLPTQDSVQTITIVPSGRALGVTVPLPAEDSLNYTKQQMMENIAVCLGGRIAELEFFGKLSTGAFSDLQKASETARKMVTQYGMSEKLGPIVYGSGHSEVFLGRELGSEQNYSEHTAALIDEEVLSIVKEASELATRLIHENRGKLELTAKFLVKNETMDGTQFKALMDNDPEPTIEELEALMEERRKKSLEENQLQEQRLKEKAEAEKKASESSDNDASPKSHNGFNDTDSKRSKSGGFFDLLDDEEDDKSEQSDSSDHTDSSDQNK